MGATAVLFHVSGLALYLYVMYFLHFQNVNNSVKSTNKVVQTMARFSGRFLTNWTYAIQAIYFALCVVQHFLSLISANRIREKITKNSDYLFTSIATPMSFMVTIIFWIVYLVDRELIFPTALDEVIPVWINHCIHTFNSVLAVIDIFLVNHRFPSWGVAMKGLLGYLVSYAVCLYGTYFHTGIWIYPLLKELDWTQRIVFSLINFLIALSMHAMVRLIHEMAWGGDVTLAEKAKKKLKTKKK